MRQKTLLGICIGMVLSCTHTAQLRPSESDIGQLILNLEQQKRAAQVRGDWQTIQAINAPDMIDIGGNGAIRTTAQNSEAMRSGALRFTTSEASDEQVRVFGEVAVVTAIGHRTGLANGAPFDQHFRYTRIYVRNGNVWRCVLAQNTRLEPASQ